MLDLNIDDLPEIWPIFKISTNSDLMDTAQTPRLLQYVVDPDLENWNPNGEQEISRLYGSKRCARCNTPISASELVMRARDLVFHVHCFSCALCSTPLNKGDTFGIRDSAVYCRLHYETMPDYGAHMAVPGPPQMCPVPYAAGPAPGPHYPPYPSPEFARVDNDVPKGPFFNGSTAPPPRQKGRPRKKKPKDQELMAANLEIDRITPFFTCFQLDLNPEYLELGFRGGAGLGSSSRTKRMRTSFKHHQLRTMKSYFAINHNPDAKDLKQLIVAKETSLFANEICFGVNVSTVISVMALKKAVWFQNARAKWRRMVTKQESKLSDKCSPDASLDMDLYHGQMGSIQSLPPHSPPYSVMGGPPSPNSMDCP
ncbi:unnamed protein product [Spodoptera littoralis]|uniref:Uncharacterized protein n=1 Tax=Spodoptera littoralis TaxID=7109 RepID=A0A9P0N9N3_SPOLI|nr:unnamed protein product [Spodoptera littoralis]CAH1647471.1 unnamed protein product [Spodoptera littoralis]